MVNILIFFSVFCSLFSSRCRKIKVDPRRNKRNFKGLKSYLKCMKIKQHSNHTGFFIPTSVYQLESNTGLVIGTKYKQVTVYTDKNLVEEGMPELSYSFGELRPAVELVLEQATEWAGMVSRQN